MIQARGGAAVARCPHTAKVAGATPAPANLTYRKRLSLAEVKRNNPVLGRAEIVRMDNPSGDENRGGEDRTAYPERLETGIARAVLSFAGIK